MNRPLLPLLSTGAVLLVVVGCASNSATLRHEPYVKPGLIMLTADQAEARGIAVQPTHASSAVHGSSPGREAVVLPADVKAYTINRTVDPADPNLLHEEHVVYRRENGAQWRLEATAEEKILIGPRVTDGRQELAPLLVKELPAFLSDQRRTTEAQQRSVTALCDSVAALARQHETLAAQVAALREASSTAAAASELPRGQAEDARAQDR